VCFFEKIRSSLETDEKVVKVHPESVLGVVGRGGGGAGRKWLGLTADHSCRSARHSRSHIMLILTNCGRVLLTDAAMVALRIFKSNNELILIEVILKANRKSEQKSRKPKQK
jgi:hypothetical protein